MFGAIRHIPRGASHRVLTGKHGGVKFYKGRGAKNPGSHIYGERRRFRINFQLTKTLVVPDLKDFPLTPYVYDIEKEDYKIAGPPFKLAVESYLPPTKASDGWSLRT